MWRSRRPAADWQEGRPLRKKTINLTVPVDLAEAFDGVCGRYGHGKQKGMVLSAAILMFIEAPAQQQADWVKRVAVAEVEGRLLPAQPRDPASPISAAQPGGPSAAKGDSRPRIAARRVRPTSRRGRRGLPPLPG